LNVLPTDGLVKGAKVKTHIDMNSVCAPSEDIVAREIEGEIIIVPVVSGIGGPEEDLYTLNETAQAIWQRLDGGKTLGAVADSLASEFDTSRTALEADVLGLVRELVDRGILMVRGDISKPA